jgi:hypothetical protein
VHRIVIRVENPAKRCISIELDIKYSSMWPRIPRLKHAAKKGQQQIPRL